MTLLDEARKLPAVPDGHKVKLARLFPNKKVILASLIADYQADRAEALEQRLAIAVRALRESAGDNWRDVDVLAIADALEVKS